MEQTVCSYALSCCQDPDRCYELTVRFRNHPNRSFVIRGAKFVLAENDPKKRWNARGLLLDPRKNEKVPVSISGSTVLLEVRETSQGAPAPSLP